MSQYAIVTALNRCVGCMACMVACKAVNNVQIGNFWNKVLRVGPTKKADYVHTNDVEVLVEVAHTVGAGADAQLATDALLGVDLHGAVVELDGGAGGANLDALGVGAVLALNRQVVYVDVREVTSAAGLGHGANTQGADPEVAHGDVVDELAGHGAGQAARAAVQVGDDRFLSHC